MFPISSPSSSCSFNPIQFIHQTQHYQQLIQNQFIPSQSAGSIPNNGQSNVISSASNEFITSFQSPSQINRVEAPVPSININSSHLDLNQHFHTQYTPDPVQTQHLLPQQFSIEEFHAHQQQLKQQRHSYPATQHPPVPLVNFPSSSHRPISAQFLHQQHQLFVNQQQQAAIKHEQMKIQHYHAMNNSNNIARTPTIDNNLLNFDCDTDGDELTEGEFFSNGQWITMKIHSNSSPPHYNETIDNDNNGLTAEVYKDLSGSNTTDDGCFNNVNINSNTNSNNQAPTDSQREWNNRLATSERELSRLTNQCGPVSIGPEWDSSASAVSSIISKLPSDQQPTYEELYL